MNQTKLPRIAMGSDHGGYDLKLEILNHLRERGFTVEDFGSHNRESVDYPIYAKKVGEAVADGTFDLGILVCGTGIGMSLAANKIDGIRAAAVSDCFTAKATREHNDANILCLGGRTVGAELAMMIADIFVDTPFSGDERHVRRISMFS